MADAVPPGRTTHFAASYDLTTKIISAVVVVALLVITAVVHNVLVGCIALLTVIVSFAYSPRGYVVHDGAITVKRLIGDVRVPLEEIREMRRISTDDLRWCIRWFGSGGLFGYYGLFRTAALGKCTWYVTRRKNAVVIIARAKTTLYSPDDVDGFLEAVRATVSVRES